MPWLRATSGTGRRSGWKQLVRRVVIGVADQRGADDPSRAGALLYHHGDRVVRKTGERRTRHIERRGIAIPLPDRTQVSHDVVIGHGPALVFAGTDVDRYRVAKMDQPDRRCRIAGILSPANCNMHRIGKFLDAHRYRERYGAHLPPRSCGILPRGKQLLMCGDDLRLETTLLHRYLLK